MIYSIQSINRSIHMSITFILDFHTYIYNTNFINKLFRYILVLVSGFFFTHCFFFHICFSIFPILVFVCVCVDETFFFLSLSIDQYRDIIILSVMYNININNNNNTWKWWLIFNHCLHIKKQTRKKKSKSNGIFFTYKT